MHKLNAATRRRIVANSILSFSIATVIALMEAGPFVNLMLLAPVLWFIMMPGGALVAGLLAEGNRKAKVICFSMTLILTVFLYLAAVVILSYLIHNWGLGNVCVIEGLCPI